MKYTVLGSNGFLSSAICKYCNENRYQLSVWGLDEPKGVEYHTFFRVDLMDSGIDVSHLLDSDIIVYAIGAGIQANLKEGFNLIHNLNVTAPISICNKLKELDFKGVFVTFGSMFEMGETKEEKFFTEENVLTSTASAPSDYVVSKRMLTRFVTSYKHDFTHWHFIIPTIYGAGENPKRLIPYVVNAIKNNEELHFTAGDQTRQYVHVSEVPRLLELAYEKKLPSGIYNIEGNETMTVKEIVELIHRVLGKDVPAGCFGTVQRTDEGMKYLALDGRKLNNSIGFEATIKLSNVIISY